MHILIFLSVVGFMNASTIFTTFKVGKFEIPLTATAKPNKDMSEDFKPNIHPDSEKLISKHGQCVVLNQFSVIEGNELLDCYASYIPLRSKYVDLENTTHILPVFMNSDSNILEEKQNITSICRKIRRYVCVCVNLYSRYLLFSLEALNKVFLLKCFISKSTKKK
jgi:hypothetical protein